MKCLCCLAENTRYHPCGYARYGFCNSLSHLWLPGRFSLPPGLTTLVSHTVYKVYFALQEDDTQLTIRTKRGLTVLELVEHDQFISDLPALLVYNYTHWLDLSNGEIELRPLENLWK